MRLEIHALARQFAHRRAHPRLVVALTVAFSFFLQAGDARAQYTAGYQTNVVDGVVSNWSGDYYIGNGVPFDQLQIVNGGNLLSAWDSYVGYASGNNSMLVSGSGSLWDSPRELYIGFDGVGNSLVVSNGGVVIDEGGSVGGYLSYAYGQDNTAVVTGVGSRWSNTSQSELDIGSGGNGNSLVISDGGRVDDYFGEIGNNGGENNMVTVMGAGSVWSNQADVGIGEYSDSNSVRILDGGTVISYSAGVGSYGNNNSASVSGTGSMWIAPDGMSVGYSSGGNSLRIDDGAVLITSGGNIGQRGSNNVVVISGHGSSWGNAGSYGSLAVGYLGTGNSLTISDGATLTCYDADVTGISNSLVISGASSLCNVQGALSVGYAGSSDSLLVRKGGTLIVTNSSGTGGLSVPGGTVTLDNGTITVDQFGADSGAIQFEAGVLQSAGTSINNNQLFAVGDGADAATFQLNGGIHSFANNLEIRNNATLTGCGTVTGSVLVDAGGMVLAACGGTLTFGNSVTNNGTIRAINGSVLESYDTVVNNGTIDVINGATNFHGAFINNGTVLDAGSVSILQARKSERDFKVRIPSVVGHTYRLQFSPSLAPATWINTSHWQSGTGGVLTFTDRRGATNWPARFYRVECTAP